jgi:hypothetical protein
MGKALRNIEKVFRNILCASQPDRWLIGSPHPNRAAQHPSDASARIGRPGASSSVIYLVVRRILLCMMDYRMREVGSWQLYKKLSSDYMYGIGCPLA